MNVINEICIEDRKSRILCYYDVWVRPDCRGQLHMVCCREVTNWSRAGFVSVALLSESLRVFQFESND